MQKKADIDIGHRAYEETMRLFPKKKQAMLAIGCSKHVLPGWECGSAPTIIYLARLCELGADVEWILTGRRRKQQ